MAAATLITGATGIVGTNLTRFLINQGEFICVISRLSKPPISLADVAQYVTWIQCDLTDTERTASVIRSVMPSKVVHLATTPFNPPTTDAYTHFNVNVMGLLHLLEAIRLFVPKSKVVVVGSCAVYQGGSDLSEQSPINPLTTYGASKASASLLVSTWVQRYQLSITELRLFTPFGPWERTNRLIPHVILSALNQKPVEIGAGVAQRDFIYMDDVVRAIAATLGRVQLPQVAYNVCSGHGRRVIDVVQQILGIMGNPVPLIIGAKADRHDEILEMSGNNKAAERDLDWKPSVLFEDGIRKTIQWISENRDIVDQLSLEA
ncbi:MAG: NAD(P)-dependent oxidoreductase [Magnetococcales bacterium]|nr:NAD(P)-dependent oxidoreductase [Magnetococcales bacterium]